MMLSDIPPTATLVSPGVWTDAPSRQRYYLDPLDAALVVARSWTPAEVAAWLTAQATDASEHAALVAAIGDRVTALRTAVTTANAFATSETQRAAVVAALPVAQVTTLAVRDELAMLHTDVSKLSAALALSLESVADLALVVSRTL